MAFETDTTLEQYRDFLLWFLRAASLVFLVFGVAYWGPIVGYSGDPDMALLALSRPDQVVTIVFAILLPVTAVGLWFGASWGVGLIAISLVINLVMVYGFPEYFEPAWWVIGGHVCIIAVYLLLRILIYRHR